MIKAGRIIGIAALLLFASCSHMAPAQITDLGDGTRGWRVTCGGWFLGTGDCYDKASYLCANRGYTVVRETDITPPESTYFWNETGAHEVVVKCNGANG
jgi:hypothetical protein